MPRKTATTTAASDQTEAIALSHIEAFQPIEIEIARDILPLKGKVYDVTTEHGMTEAKADLKSITSYLSRLEQARKVTKDEPFRLCQLIDSEAKRISVPVELNIKAPLKAVIEQEEGRLARIEAARVEAIRNRIAVISRRPGWGAKAADIRTMLLYVEGCEIDAAFAELQDEATIAKAEALRDLRHMLATAQQVEQQQADLLRQQEELKAGHARLREQQALVEQQAAEVPVVETPTLPETAVQKGAPPPLTAAEAIGHIIAACDRLTFIVEGDEAHEAIAVIRDMARRALRLAAG